MKAWGLAVVLALALGCDDGGAAMDAAGGAGGTTGAAGSVGSGGVSAQAGTTGSAGARGGTTGSAVTGSGGTTGGASAVTYGFCSAQGWSPKDPVDCAHIGANTTQLFRDGYLCIVCSNPQRPAGVTGACWYDSGRALCVTSCDQCAP